MLLVDEAQDFPPAFMQMCYSILSDPKRLVYAYDELQNLSGESLPPPEELFGRDPGGRSHVAFRQDDDGLPRQDVILDKCYRNSRPVLVSAHGLGFGVYRQPTVIGSTGLVQMFDDPQLWLDIGYKIRSGHLQPGNDITLYRPESTSPLFLEAHSPIDDILMFKRFESQQEQAQWLVREILRNLEDDELRVDDIIVINPDPRTTGEKVGLVRKLLFEAGVNSHVAGVDSDPDVFFWPSADSITFTGIHRAKGKEAGMVYIVNAHDCFDARVNLATIRNQLFTAITRSKAWVRVLGVGEAMDELTKEFDKLRANDFSLTFQYPTEAERQQIKLIHRDVSPVGMRTLDTSEKHIEDIIKAIDDGRMVAEQVRPDLVEELLKRLGRGG